MKKKKKLTGQQIKFIINIVSLAVFAISYLYIYSNYVKKTNDTYKEIKYVEQYITATQEKAAKKDEVLQNTKEVSGQIQEILDRYPVDIKNVDNLLFVDQMGKDLGITFSSIYATDSSPFYNTTVPMRNSDGTEVTQPVNVSSSGANTAATVTTAPGTDSNITGSKSQSQALNDIDTETATDSTAPSNPSSTDQGKTDGPPTMTGLQSTITLSFQTTADGFTKLVDYINNCPSKTVIDSVSITVDGTTNMLTGSLVIKRFALAGTGKEYVESKNDDFSIGTDDIFGTGFDTTVEPTPTIVP